MSSSIIRGKYVICKITGRESAEVVSDGAVYQEDGAIVEVGKYDDLDARHPGVEVIGSPSYVVMPGLVNDHFHVGLTPFQLGSPDLPLEMWGVHRLGARHVYPYLDQLYGAVQMIETGTTTVQAIHNNRRGSSPIETEVADKVIGAFQASGMRVAYAPITADQHMIVVGPRGNELEFAAQLPDDLGERFGSSMSRGLGRLLSGGIRVAIGSDEAGLNDDKDLFQEMRLVLKIHRVPGVDNVPPTAHQVFQMATANGAHAAWFWDRVGTLEPGKRADITLLHLRNIEEPFLDPTVPIVDAVVHRGRSADVDTVIVDGEVVMRDRVLTKVDKEALFKELKATLDRPLEPDEIDRRNMAKQMEPHLRRFFQGTMPADYVPHTVYNARS